MRLTTAERVAAAVAGARLLIRAGVPPAARLGAAAAMGKLLETKPEEAKMLVGALREAGILRGALDPATWPTEDGFRFHDLALGGGLLFRLRVPEGAV